MRPSYLIKHKAQYTDIVLFSTKLYRFFFISATSGDLLPDFSFDTSPNDGPPVQLSGIDPVVIFPEIQFPYDTTLRRLLLVSTEAGIVTFYVFRPISGNNYYIVAKVEFQVPLSGSSVIIV